MAKHPGSAQRRMSAEWDLVVRYKNSYLHSLFTLYGSASWKHERRLLKIRLPCKCLHFFVAQTAGVRYDGKRVSFQPSRGEHVNLNEAVAAFAIIPRCFRTLSDRLKSSRETSSPNSLNKASTVELVLHKQPPPIIAASKGLGRIN